MKEISEMKRFAISTARKAGNLLLKNFRKDIKLTGKRGTAKELHLLQDMKSDRLIIDEIKKKYPQHNILTEESGLIKSSFKSSSNNKSRYTWIVDPLDGSTNFARGNPFFSVSIALMKGTELILGVVDAPFLKELYVAEKGKGAYLNGKKLHVSGRSRLSESYLVSCEGGDNTNRQISMINAKFLPLVKDLRKLGSAALESASVASGRSEAYIVRQIEPWDVAAGVLLVQEAGGKVTDFTGKGWGGRKSNLVFSNGKVHLKILRNLSAIS